MAIQGMASRVSLYGERVSSSSTDRRSNLAVVLLAMLLEGPMHAYGMRRLIEERGKDAVVNVARSNSVYQAIDRLRRAELVQVRETLKDKGRPDRTVFEITDLGRITLDRWLDEMISTPAREFPEFPAALATITATTPQNALKQFRARAATLADQLARAEATITAAAATVPRVFLIEDEYSIAVMRTELQWIRSLIDDLQAGKLTWTEEWLRRFAKPEP
jgi:DNA-binding PadR family transcriptional regulator